MTPARLLASVAALALAAGLGGCAADGDDRTLTVLAAASLTDTYTELAGIFEAQHDDVEVRLVLDSSATLADKAIDRAPGDVLATADRRTIEHAEAGGGTVGEPRLFATNVLVVAVPEDNPAGIGSIDDLEDPDVDYLACVRTAPCGAAARRLLDAVGITHEPASEETDVRAVLAKVAAGEADAGLVYRSDAVAARGEVEQLPIRRAGEQPNSYWVAVTAAADDPGLAGEWISLVLGARGQQVLEEAGFGPPVRR